MLIAGMGPLGLLALFDLAQRGWSVDVVDPQPHRRELAVALGAVGPMTQRRLQRWKRCIPALSNAQGATRRSGCSKTSFGHGGTICVLSDGNHEPLVLRPAFHEHELRVIGSSDGEDYRAHAAWFLPRAQTVAAILRSLFELTVPKQTAQPRCCRVVARSRPHPLKILVRYTNQRE